MVKLKGPALSLAAGGSIADTVTFASWKGQHYLRKRVKGTNPRSPAQLSMRTILTFLAKGWADITPANKATWNDLADIARTSPFNAYLRYNLQQWRHFHTPTMTATRYEAVGAENLSNEAATPGVQHVLISADVDNLTTQNWGVCIFRALASPVIPQWDNCVQITKALSATSFTWTDSPLAPGHYYYQFRPFAFFGKMGVNQLEVDAIIA